MAMFVVRNIFSQADVLADNIKALIAKGRLDASVGEDPEALGFLIHEGGALSLTDAAYRFVRHTPGIDVTLFGTGSIAHLEANIASILRPPLPAGDVERLHKLFSHLKGVGLDLPGPPSRG
jgi:L-galactose dehydrogenase